MFSLVRFDNNELQIVPAKRINNIKDRKCTVNVKGSKYCAEILKTHDSKELLEKSKKSNSKQNLRNEVKKKHVEKSISSVKKTKKEILNVAVSDSHIKKIDQELNKSLLQMPLPADCEHYVKNLPIAQFIEVYDLGSSIEKKSESTFSTVFPEIESSISSPIATELEEVNLNSIIEKNCELTFLPVSPEIETAISLPIGTEIEAIHLNSNIEKSCESSFVPVSPEKDYETNTPIITEIEASNGNVSGTLTLNNDSTYVPDNTTISVEEVSHTSEKSEVLSNCQPVDVRKVIVPSSKSINKRMTKKHFCPYCNKLQSKFARHLELVHNSETEVQKFIKLPKGNFERKQIIETIRKNGNYIHNTHSEHNTGILITSRQQVSNQNSAEDYICCKSCKGFFSKKTLRLHYRRCSNSYTKGTKTMMIMGRKIAGYIHPRANITLRRKVFPVLRDDPITRLIKYDQLIIIFGNKLCDKYTLQHQHDMIRSNLRLLGRFLTAVKEIDKNITDLSSIFQPKFFDTVLEGIKICASYNLDKGIFEAPSVATSIGTLLKKCLKIHMSECIKTQNEIAKKAADDFLILYEEDIPTTINRKVLEDQLKNKRNKVANLPTKNDISCLYSYLKLKMSEAHDALYTQFNLQTYNTLSECTLVLLQIFNRRRAGEIERLLISDYKNQETIDSNSNSDLLYTLSPESQNRAKKFIRITIRGKLGRIVPVLLDTFIVKCIETLILFRRKAGISRDNDYVFALPAKNGQKTTHLRACPLLRKFSEECGAAKPCTLRGTTLRKHVATHTALCGMEEGEVSDLANFMGHHKDIHKNIYRVPIPLKDLANVSKILESAMGFDGDHTNKSDNIQAASESSIAQRSKDEFIKTSRLRSQCLSSNDSLSNESKKNGELGEQSENKQIKKSRRHIQRFVSSDSLSNETKSPAELNQEIDAEPSFDSCEVESRNQCLVSNDLLSNETKCPDELNQEIDADPSFDSCEVESRNQCLVSNDLLSNETRCPDELNQEIDADSSFDSCEIRSKIRRSTSPFGKTKRIRWNSEEKAAISHCFGDPTKCSKLPSLTQCFEAVKSYKALNRRTPQQIKTWIDNQRKAQSRLLAYKSKKAF